MPTEYTVWRIKCVGIGWVVVKLLHIREDVEPWPLLAPQRDNLIYMCLEQSDGKNTVLY